MNRKDWQNVMSQSKAYNGHVEQELPAYKIAWPEATWLQRRRRELAEKENKEQKPKNIEHAAIERDSGSLFGKINP